MGCGDSANHGYGRSNHGRDDIGDKALITESLDIFKTQQRLAHENGLKVTIQMTYAALFNDEAVELAKHDHEVYLFRTDMYKNNESLCMCVRVVVFIYMSP